MVTYRGRKPDDMEIIGGVNVNPREVELLIAEDENRRRGRRRRRVREPTGASTLQAYLVCRRTAPASVHRSPGTFHRGPLGRLSAFSAAYRLVVERLP